MSQSSEKYTILIMPNHTAQPYRFSIRKKTVKWFFGLLTFFLVATTGVFADYFAMLGRMTTLSGLREETQTQHVQLKVFQDAIRQMEKRLIQLTELGQKVRMMLGPIPRDLEGQGHEDRSGRGGREIPSLLPGRAQAVEEDLVWALTQQRLVNLQGQLERQKQNLIDLTGTLEQQHAEWTALPSLLPVSGKITSRFGKRTSPFTGMLAMHEGIDIAAPFGSPVVSSADGVIIQASADPMLGKYVKIRHRYGRDTYYAHLSRIAVRPSRSVKQGEIVGYVGNTGLSTGPHLHYEVHMQGRPVDPLPYISRTQHQPWRDALS